MNQLFHNNERIYTPVILGLSLLLGLFLTKPLYDSYMSTKLEYITLEKQLQEDQSKLEALTNLKNASLKTVSGSTTETGSLLDRLDKVWNPSDVISAVMLNEYTLTNSFTTPKVSIGNISINKGTKLPSGISLGSVSVNVSASSLDNMVEYINYLTEHSPYVFLIDEISLPIDTKNGSKIDNGLTLSLSLGVYYYQ